MPAKLAERVGVREGEYVCAHPLPPGCNNLGNPQRGGNLPPAELSRGAGNFGTETTPVSVIMSMCARDACAVNAGKRPPREV